MRFLRTNTAVRVTVGPFFDKTDGVTPETAITVTSCKLTFMVDDSNVPTLILDTAPTASGGANDMVHVTGDDAGFYDLELAAANVNYLGRAMLAITDAATHCPVFHEFMILPANIYDSMVLGTDLFDVSVTQNAGSAITSASGIQEVKVASIAANAITATAINADAITDAKVAADVTIASVTGAVGSVTGNVGGNVVGSVGSVTGAVGSVTGAVGSVSGLTAATVHSDLDDIQARLPAALTAGGNIKADALAIDGSTTGATHLAAHALTAVPVTFDAGGSTTTAVLINVDGAAASATDDFYNGRVLIFTAPSGLKYQVTDITDYVGATKTATITAVTTATGATTTAIMV